MTDQIQKDLTRWADTKLDQWQRDVGMRFEVVGLHQSDAFVAVTMCLMTRIVAILTAYTDADPKDAAQQVYDLMKAARAEHEKIKQRRG